MKIKKSKPARKQDYSRKNKNQEKKPDISKAFTEMIQDITLRFLPHDLYR